MTSRMPDILRVKDDEVDVINVHRAFHTSRIPSPLLMTANGEEALEMPRAGTWRDTSSNRGPFGASAIP